MKKKLVVIPIIVAIIAIATFPLYSPLFVNAVVDEPLPEMMTTNEPAIIWTGNFVGVGDGIHDAAGIAKVLSVTDGQSVHRIVRLENFKATNGPDLYVYLSKDPTSINGGIINLGRLKGNIGNQNYEIPDDADLEEYNNVLIWCKMFSVLFGHTDLQAT
jgi:hypothetical protein